MLKGVTSRFSTVNKTFENPLIAHPVICCTVLSCLTLGDPIDNSPPGSSVHGDSAGTNTGVGCHALLQGNLSDSPEMEPASHFNKSPALAGGFFIISVTWEAISHYIL